MTAQILQDADERTSYHEAVKAVGTKCALDPSSPIKAPLERAIGTATTRLEERAENDLGWGGWRPPLLVLAELFTTDELLAFDADCRRVAGALRCWDVDSPDKWNEWHGQLFELSLKVRLCDASLLEIDFDRKLSSDSNSRDVDISLGFSRRPIRVEATVHCESDEQRGIEQRWMNAKKLDPELVLEQPGSFDPTDDEGNPLGREPHPAYTCVRAYAKVYGKLAKNLDPDATQFDGTVPTVLVINLPRGGNKARRGMEMAMEELFSSARDDFARSEALPAGSIKTTLVGWLDHYAQELLKKGELQWDRYTKSRKQLLVAPRRISAIAVFERYTFSFSRINYDALPSCLLTHAEMAQLDELFAMPPPIWTRRMLVGPD